MIFNIDLTRNTNMFQGSLELNRGQNVWNLILEKGSTSGMLMQLLLLLMVIMMKITIVAIIITAIDSISFPRSRLNAVTKLLN